VEVAFKVGTAMLDRLKSVPSGQSSLGKAWHSTYDVLETRRQLRRVILVRWIAVIGAIFASISIGFYAITCVETRAWPLLIPAVGVVVALLCLLQARRLVPRAPFDAAGYWMLAALVVAYGSGELVWTGLSPWHAVGAILLTVLVGNLILRRKWGAWLLAAGTYGLFALPVNTFDSFPRFDVTQSPELAISILGVTTSVALVLLLQLVLDFRPITIRSRLFVAFVLMVLLPAIGVAAVSSVVGFRSGRQQVIEQLESVATIKEAEVDTWASNVQTDLATVATGDRVTRHMREILSPSVDPMGYQVAYNELRQHLGQMVERSPRLDGLFLMDLERRVVLSTDPAQEGASGAPGSLAYFRQGLKGEYLHRASYSLSVGGIAVIAVRPVLDDQGQALGILAGRAGPATLSEIMGERAGLGQTGETYLVTLGHIMLTEPRFRKERWDQTYYVFSEGADAALEEHTNGYGSYSNYRGERVLGVYRWLPDLKLALLAEQAESEALVAVYTTVGINVGVTVVAVLVAAVVSLFLARSIALPLADLAETAVRVAGGELEHTADVRRDDEIGALARAFNTMTTQLRESISGLEQRVQERTQALQRRALQLETSTRVSREITSILDIDDLLKRVVELIKRAFGYYYVAVFLVDDETNTLVFAAGSGELGQRRKREGMRLMIGAASLNGHVAQSNKAAMVNDVSQDPRYVADERLADTRSELVIPLRIGGRVLGTLDVQSAQMNAFSEEDVRIMQSMGDQVAVAIENARLYDRSRTLAVLEERNRLAHELHDSVTQSLYSLVLFAGAGQEIVEAGLLEPVKQYLQRIEETAQQALKEMRLLVYELRPPTLEEEGLLGALRQRLKAVEERAGIDARLLVEGDVDLPAPLQERLYRIAQEALNNALKHSAGTSVAVRIHVNDERLELEVVDDGVGFDVDAVSDTGGLGLAMMRERAAELGGLVLISSAPGEGTTVKITVDKRPRGRSGDLSRVSQ